MTAEQEKKLRQLAEEMNEEQLDDLLRYARELKAGG